MNKLWRLSFFVLFMASCIEPYQPDIEGSRDLLVVNGCVTDEAGEHTVEISRSSSYDNPLFIPVQGCVVYVEDEAGSGVTYTESSPGIYKADLEPDFVGLNKAFRLHVFTPDGKEYQSEYDTILPCPSIEAVDYKIESRETSNPYVTYYGIRFYLDMAGNESDARNFLWKFVETWEYNSAYFIGYFWDGDTLFEYDPMIDSLYICYKTEHIQEIFTASTKFLVSNSLNDLGLNFVSNQSERLKIKYSLLVRQHSLTDRAFIFWDQLKNQMSSGGGLYEKQPPSISGNIFNIDDPNEKVLGLFYASQVNEKRVMVERSFSFPLPVFPCVLDTVEVVEDLGKFPYYMFSLAEEGFGPPYGVSDPACFDCTLRGGVTERPYYWDYFIGK